MKILDLFLKYWHEVDSRPKLVDFGMGMPHPKLIYSEDILIPDLINGLNSRADYQPQCGNYDLRKSIALFESKKTGLNYCVNNVMMVSGGIRGFSLFIDEFSSFKTTYFEILPSYPLLSGYVETSINKSGGKLIKIKADITQNLSFNIDEIVSKIEANSIAFITNPNNPTGLYYPNDLLSNLVNILQNKQSYLVIDESCDIPYDNIPIPEYFLSPNVIRIRSFSKDLLLAGFRIGYIVADEQIIRRLSNRFIFSDGNAPLIVNHAIQEYCQHPEFFSKQIKQYCINRYKYMFDSLNNTNLFDIITRPQACYYLLARVKNDLSSWDTFLNLINSGINVVPGSLFRLSTNEAWIRLCFARDISDIDNGVSIISSALKKSGGL